MKKFMPQVFILVSIAILVLSLMGCDRLPRPTGEYVEKVSDGDTLVVSNVDGAKFTVRFACVDAPEVPHSKRERESKLNRDVNQFNWGNKAQTRIEQLIKENGNFVNLNITDSDRYGRKVAEVRLADGTFLQQILLQEGLAKVYRPYLRKCPSKDIVEAAETQAQKRKIGIWSDPQFIDPWQYRKLSK
ncbi:nuclease (SNase domain protein) [Richelia sinica FACHB-800]|uniref:Nuclease (SNase domain protein) n=1 Tax=Richelia sinica FACHB-800 TaxID=1357546 RepID=A0A975T5G5_9NOST|nr:thermonuclease family protein [Richelia sinica FACHB-800]QXE22596.1 nuclease (SNase domain protein) [Richelia sinica FACHB-800]